jgi:MSHA biogenesis protein MshP
MKAQQGLSLVLVIFILVVLSLLGTAMLRMLSVSSDAVAREVLATRALHAAHSGVQAKLREIFVDRQLCDTSSPAFTALQGCTVTIESCSTLEVPVGSGVNYYTIVSKGSCGPAGEQAVRRVEVQAKDL